MSWQDVYEEHGRWWTVQHAGEPALLPALGMLKALRNFVHPLLKAKQTDTKGVDNRPKAVESIGDMLMYSCALYRSLGMAKFVEPKAQEYVTVELAVGALAVSTGILIIQATIWSSAVMHRVMEQVNTIAGLADVCCVDVFEAAAVSLRKLK